MAKKHKNEDISLQILRVRPDQAQEFLRDLQREHDKMIEKERQAQEDRKKER